ncbi:MAG: chorismate-binding protein, partial [Myxococcales bacterium]|nr:chorismate-binding protein [Myxococcales bacterium]
GFGRAAVAIRSTHLSPQTAWLFAGVGVVAESSPAAEWRETELKLGVAGERLRLCAEEA